MAEPADLQPTLADIRREIDRIDEAMHRLLMERAEARVMRRLGLPNPWRGAT